MPSAVHAPDHAHLGGSCLLSPIDGQLVKDPMRTFHREPDEVQDVAVWTSGGRLRTPPITGRGDFLSRYRLSRPKRSEENGEDRTMIEHDPVETSVASGYGNNHDQSRHDDSQRLAWNRQNMARRLGVATCLALVACSSSQSSVQELSERVTASLSRRESCAHSVQ
jgi:hypothetical protein